MGEFSKDMRRVALDLMKELGNPCVLSKIDVGDYNTLTGETLDMVAKYETFSAPTKNVSVMFGNSGQNTGLSGFADDRVTVPWVGCEIDTTWLFNGNDITQVEPVSTEGDIVVYNLTVAED